MCPIQACRTTAEGEGEATDDSATGGGVKVHFFRDGGTDSYAQTVQLQVQGAEVNGAMPGARSAFPQVPPPPW